MRNRFAGMDQKSPPAPTAGCSGARYDASSDTDFTCAHKAWPAWMLN